MILSNLNLNIGTMAGYNNKILVSNTGMKIGSNKNINTDHRKLSLTAPEDDVPKMVKSTDKPINDHHAVQHDNPKILAKKHNDEKLVITLLIVGAGMIAYYFW